VRIKGGVKVRLVKHLRHGNNPCPVTFVRHNGKCGYAWGFLKRELLSIPTSDFVAAEKGVTWHPDFFTAMVAWSNHRSQKRGGMHNGRTAAMRPLRKSYDLQGA